MSVAGAGRIAGGRARPIGMTADGRVSVVASTAVEERLQAARAFVERFGPGTEILIVGATREAADDLARETARRAERRSGCTE